MRSLFGLGVLVLASSVAAGEEGACYTWLNVIHIDHRLSTLYILIFRIELYPELEKNLSEV